jgi:PAS domain S-box-containing protein
MINSDTFRLIFENSATGMALLNKQGGFLLANKKLRELLGYSSEEFCKRTLSGIIVDRGSQEVLDKIQWICDSQIDSFATKQRLFQNNDAIIWVQIDIALCSRDLENDVFLIASFENFTDRRQLEEKQRQHLVLAEALRDSVAALTSTLNLEQVLDRILLQVERVVPYDTASFMLVDRDIAAIVRCRGWTERDAEDAVLSLRFSVQDTDSLRVMFESGRPFSILDTRLYDGWRTDIPEIQWIRSYIGVPVRTGDEFFGFLNLDSSQPGAFSDEQAYRLQTFADQAAIALQNARLYEKLQSYTTELEVRVEQRTRELQRAKDHVEVVLNSSSDAILLFTTEGTILQTNPAFLQLFGFAHNDEAFGQNILDFVEADELRPTLNIFRSISEKLEPVRTEIVFRRLDGTAIVTEMALAAIEASQGARPKLVCSLHDITKRIKIETELRKAIEKEKELNDLKSRFSTMVSHEFRTPLSIISTKNWILRHHQSDIDEEKVIAAHDQIETQVKVLASYLEDIDTIRKSQSIGFDFAPQNIDLGAFCRDIIGDLEVTSPTHHLELDVTGDCESVEGDPKLLRHIMINLVGNAIKYSSSGSKVTIRIACSKVGSVLEVHDEGIGIPKEDLEHIFEPFHRGKNAATIMGTGLGLTIVKWAVESHQGAISVESEIGHGATFKVTLPRLDADKAQNGQFMESQ